MKKQFKIFVLTIFVFIVSTNLLFAQGFLKSLAKGLSEMGTEKTTTLKNAAITARYWGNCYSKNIKIGTGEELFLADIWEEGANIVSITFYKTKGLGAYQIDGTVKAGGIDMPYLGNGLYAVKVKDNKPKTISVETKSGEKIDVTVKPVASVEILEPKNSEVDTKKDLTVKLKNPPGSENTQIRIALYSKPTVTQNSWHTINYFHSKDVINVPAFSFASTHDSKFDYVKGESFLLAERFTVVPEKIAGVGEVRNISCYYSISPVKTNVQKTEWFPAKETRKEDGYEITENGSGISISCQPGEEKKEPYMPGVNIRKDNMVDGIPFVKARKMAVIAFTVRATELKQTHATTRTDYTGNTGVDKLITVKFPAFSISMWESISKKMFEDFQKQMKEKMNIEIIPVEDVLKAPSYQDLKEIRDTVDEESYVGTYKGLKKLYSNNLMSIFGAYTGPQKRLMQELGVYGVITLDLNLKMPSGTKDGEYDISLEPNFSYNIYGTPNGTEFASTMFCSGTCSGKGITLQKLGQKVGKEKNGKQGYTWNEDVLVKSSRAAEIINAMTDVMKKLKAEEEKLGYNKLWELK